MSTPGQYCVAAHVHADQTASVSEHKLVARRRRGLTRGAFDTPPADGLPGQHASSCLAAAAMLLHLIKPNMFGMETAAAACAALAAPLMAAVTDAALPGDSSLPLVAHQAVALTGLRSLGAALSVPGFAAAVAEEEPSALPALVAGLRGPGAGAGQTATATALAPTAYEVLCCTAATWRRVN